MFACLQLYRQLLTKARKHSDAAIERLANGLQKLRDTAATVVTIEEDLKIKLVAAEVGMLLRADARAVVMCVSTAGKARCVGADCS